MAERKFKRLITGSRPGTAAQARESVAQTIRQSSLMARPNVTDPIDYEDFLSQNMTMLNEDPHPELLLISTDDVVAKKLERKTRTTKSIPAAVSLLPNFLTSGGTDPPADRKQSVSSSTPTRENRSVSIVSTTTLSNNETPALNTLNCNNLHIRDCIESFTKDWNVIEYRHEQYSGNWSELPKLPKLSEHLLQDQVYEIDDDYDANGSDDTLNGLSLLTKEGYILKGSEAGTDSFLSVATKSFKKRWMSLRQELDGSCSLEFYKDNKKRDPKGSICLEFCQQIVRNPKRGKYAFELRMSEGHKPYILATESDADLEGWIDSLTKAISSKSETSSRKSIVAVDSDSSSISGSMSTPPSTPKLGQSFRSQDLSRLPDLIKYSHETEVTIADLRKDRRVNVFTVYPDLLSRKGCFNQLRYSAGTVTEPYSPKFGFRFLFTCDQISLNFHMIVDGVKTHIEPLFASASIFHTKLGKITEEFRFDINDDLTRQMISGESLDRHDSTCDSITEPLRDFPLGWVTRPKSAIFSVQSPSPDMFLVVRIEKVLSGSISSASEPYIKANEAPKTAVKCHKTAKSICQRMGPSHRMPFLWTARPLFKSCRSLDLESEFGPFFRQDSHRISDEEIIKHLNSIRGLEKPKNVTIIPGRLVSRLEVIDCEDCDDFRIENTVTCNYLPIKPFPSPPTEAATIEVSEFLVQNPRECHPFTEFVNLLFVHPRSLKYDCQKLFPKARNITITTEYRECDDEFATSLPVIFNRPASGEAEDFVTQASTNILHHNTCPDSYDEVKILLPLNLTEKHHLLFTLKHVSCSNSKKDVPVETVVGYAWIPIYPSKGKLNLQEVSIAVAAHLPPGYLSYKPLGLGKGFAGPEIKWIDSGKEIFRVGFKLVSSIFPIDCNLHAFLYSSGKMLEFNRGTEDGSSGDATSSIFNRSMSDSADPERGFSRFVQAQHGMPKILKSLLETDPGSIIRFFPVLMTQLLRMIVSTTSDDVQQSCLRMIIHILHQLRSVRKEEIAVSYVEFFFTSDSVQSANGKLNLHEELIRTLFTFVKHGKDEFPLMNNLIENSWFFFQLTVKSMAHHLLSTGIMNSKRTDRFTKEFHDQLMSYTNLFVQLLIDKNKELSNECKIANQNLAYFVNRAFSLMDRGFVFHIVKAYMDRFHAAKDSLTLQQYKFEFLAIVTAHEHYVPLNLPLSARVSQCSTPSKSSYNSCRGIIEEEEEVNDGGDRCDHNTLDSRGSILVNCNNNNSTDLPVEEETFLSEEFLKTHFTAGILLQETKSALSEVHQIRGMALQVLRNLLVKHSMDDRYSTSSQQSRIASLYFPFLPVILENINRIQVNGSIGLGHSFGSSQQSCHTMVSKRVSFMDGIANSSPTNSLDAATVSLIKQQLSVRKGSAYELTLHKKDSSYLQLIAGSGMSHPLNGHIEQLANSETLMQLNSSDPDIASKSPSPDPSDAVSQVHSQQSEKSFHQRSLSLPVRFDKFNAVEGRDLLIIFAWIVKHVSEASLTKFLKKSSDQKLIQFLNLHEICLHEFRYNGRKDSKGKSTGERAMTLPARIFDPATASDKHYQLYSGLLEANLATEIGLITLDVIGIFLKELSGRVSCDAGENVLMKKIFDLFITFLRLGQSEILLKHLFASFRSFLIKFPDVLFSGSPSFVGELCFELLKCCSSRISSVRSEAAAFLYLLMRANFYYQDQFSMTRVHLQVIISVSKLLGESNIVLLNNSRFQESLAIINNFSSSDKSVKESKFPAEVRELTKKIRTVLMATAAMREHENDPEMLMDLQWSLANSYAETSPALRRTWLESMANRHIKEGNLSEAAHCFAHIAALESEIIDKRLRTAGNEKTRGPRPSDFVHISMNIPRDESNAGCKSVDGSHGNEEHFSESALIKTLETTATLFTKAERFEMVPEVYKILIPIHERHRNFEALAKIYKTVSSTYERIMQVRRSGKRILGRYFRVAFFGRDFFDEDSGREYVYKEPKVTSLAEISERLKDVFGKKFGHENVRLIMTEKEVDEKNDCDPKYAYIQVTHVHPYNHAIEPNDRLTDFEKFDNNLSKFMFETPFSLSNPAKARSSSCSDQCKRRTVLTTMYQFPYVVKRIPVISKTVQVLSPIEVAIDEMETRVRELEEVVVTSDNKPDLKKLQLKLQGSVSVQVNAGPLAYARAFLPHNSRDSHDHLFPAQKVHQLKSVFNNFTIICEMALQLNEKWIASDQHEYQESLRSNFKEMVSELAQWLKCRSPDDDSEADLTLSFNSQISDLTTNSDAVPLDPEKQRISENGCYRQTDFHAASDNINSSPEYNNI